MTDTQLISSILDGDRSKFNALVWRWEKPLYNFILRYLGNRELAREVTQKTFIRVYQNLSKLRDVTKFSSWIYQIAANLCRDEIKKRDHRQFISLDMIQQNSDENGVLLPEELQQSPAQQPDVRMNQKQLRTIVQKALEQLPEEQRVVIIMKEYQGLKFREIAEALNEPLNTIKSRMYYGLNGLRKIFEQWQITEEVLPHEL
ncbi:MAG: sigma-70 family RNA polymerase sigma factor [candidate division KSB1 bacterium]|nr:sigma-70 family RNA polymerase sigma factor [candidate division KSB1 bacterium]MDZ7318435.1 sigma-70 family RNA polymerase sigma factor [candidate division KSB1 bacterium]MDZ7342520.1 sigma-70 family RNA polymerase sigma factor [candidate division KSB1 bacterium]